MPNGVFPVPRFHPRQNDRPTLSQRLRTLWHRTELDHQLAQGVDPATSDELRVSLDNLHGSNQSALRPFEGSGDP